MRDEKQMFDKRIREIIFFSGSHFRELKKDFRLKKIIGNSSSIISFELNHILKYEISLPEIQ